MPIYGGVFPKAVKPFSPATASSDGQAGGVPAPKAGEQNNFLRGDGEWATPPGGGDVTGPGSSINNAVVRFSGTSGTSIQDSPVILTNTGTFQGVQGLSRDSDDIDIVTTTGGDINLLAADGVSIQGISYPDSDGTAGQALVTDGLGNLSFGTVAADIDRNNLVYVDGEFGNDSNDGKLGSPFATIQAAIDSVIGASDDFNRYGVIIAPGNYTEDVVLKLSVNLYGAGTTPELVRINGNITFDAPGAFTHRVELGNMLWQNGNFVITNTGGSACIVRAFRINFSSLNITVNSGQLQFYGCGFFGGTVTANSASQTFFNTSSFSGTNYVVNGNVTSQIYDSNWLGGTATLNDGTAYISMSLATTTFNVETGGALFINANTANFATINDNGGSISYLDSANHVTASYSASNYTATSAQVSGHLEGIDDALDGVQTFSWEEVNADGNLAVNTGYVVDDTSLVTLTLPATASRGDTFKVFNFNTGGWRVAQNADQTIYLGETTTTTGATGYIESTSLRDTMTLVCVKENTDFIVESSVGNLNLE